MCVPPTQQLTLGDALPAGSGRRFAVVRVPAAWPDAAQQSGREHASLVDLVAQRADDREIPQVLLPWGLAHTPR